MRWYLTALSPLILCQPGFTAEPDVARPSFINEVVPLLTKMGCNQGACHGKGSGQNGFRLSLRGYAPEQDYQWLTREFSSRRIDTANPAESLLVKKAAALVPHEGGRLFAPASREYTLLLDWIRGGLPGPSKADRVISQLELKPAIVTLKPGEEVQLIATASFTDGSKADVTWLTKFDANDAAFVTVSPTGRATAVRNGTAAVRAMFQTEVAVAAFRMPFDRAIDAKRFERRNNFVDDHVFEQLKDLRIEPSDLCSDTEFVRRVMLDTCGILPSPAEVRTFLADADPKKPEKFITAALSRPEFTDYWTLQLGDLLQNRKERDHDVRGAKNVRQFHEWLRQQVAANRPWDDLAREVLTATGSTAENPAVGYFVVTVGEHREAEKSEVGESVAQAFLGTRIGCAKCHNHPLERFTQDDFYHFAAYFSRIKFDRKESKLGPTSLSVGHPDANQNKNPVGVTQPRTGMFMKPQPLDRTSSEIGTGADPRAALAKWITNPGNEAFAGSMVNRIWRHYLGVGLIEPVDDLRATNPPSNPALFSALKKEFVGTKYDLRHLMSVILNSRAYQLSSATQPSNQADARFYSHYYARRLPAEVMLDAISGATGVPERFDGYPLGLRAVQVPDPGTVSYFLRTFGRSERVTACACERGTDVSLPQVLHLIGGETTTGKVASPSGWLAKALKDQPNDDVITTELYLRTLSRLPSQAELEKVRDMLKQTPRDVFFKDLFWALLNSKEFLFNY